MTGSEISAIAAENCPRHEGASENFEGTEAA